MVIPPSFDSTNTYRDVKAKLMFEDDRKDFEERVEDLDENLPEKCTCDEDEWDIKRYDNDKTGIGHCRNCGACWGYSLPGNYY